MGLKWPAFKIFGGIAPAVPTRRSENHYLFVRWGYTMHRFGHFPFTDFYQTWQEHANQCLDESYGSWILKFLRSGVPFPQLDNYNSTHSFKPLRTASSSVRLRPLGPWSRCDFWPQTLKRSSLSQSASKLKVWWKCVEYFSGCVNNVREAQTHRFTDCMNSPNTQRFWPLCWRGRKTNYGRFWAPAWAKAKGYVFGRSDSFYPVDHMPRRWLFLVTFLTWYCFWVTDPRI